jgi:hypothetical protein
MVELGRSPNSKGGQSLTEGMERDQPRGRWERIMDMDQTVNVLNWRKSDLNSSEWP